MLQQQTLSGKRILVVEDEWGVAMFVRQTLEDAGATVVGVADTCLDACQILDGTGVEAAVIDLHLRGGGTGHPLAHLLALRGIPFLIGTGHAAEASRVHPDAIVLQKPFSGADLIAAVESLLGGRVSQRARN